MLKNTNDKSHSKYTNREIKAHTLISVRVTQKERNELQKIANENARSLSSQARILLIQNLTQADDRKITS